MTALVEEVNEGALALGAERNRATMMGGPVHLVLERFRLHPLRLARDAPELEARAAAAAEPVVCAGARSRQHWIRPRCRAVWRVWPHSRSVRSGEPRRKPFSTRGCRAITT